MNHALSIACLVAFAVLPAAVLGLRAVRPRLMPWWAVFPAVIGPGWALTIVSGMLTESTRGGAGHVGALFFGWAIVLVWFAPWLLAYAVIQFFRRRPANRST